MAQNITLLGANYPSVPAVKLPKTGGGTATFTDVTDTTAAASDVANGKYFYTANGTKTQGTGGGGTPTLQAKTYTVNSAGTATITADSGYDGLSQVDVSVPSASFYTDTGFSYFTENNTRKWRFRGITIIDPGEGDHAGWISEGEYNGNYYTFNAVPQNTTITPTTSAQTIGGLNYMMESAVTVNAMPSGTAGTPTATKGAVSNHSVTVTPSVTNTTGYITGSTKTGTAVTVSASELVSGSETKTTNGTYDVTNLASLVVNVSGGSSKNVQIAQSTTRATSSTYTNLISLTCSKAGKYDIYWDCFRSSTGGTSGSQLYIGGQAYGTANTVFTNHAQNNHLTNVTLQANQTVAVYARSRGSNYYTYVGQLTIIEA